jgi:hypothetical protein
MPPPDPSDKPPGPRTVRRRPIGDNAEKHFRAFFGPLRAVCTALANARLGKCARGKTVSALLSLRSVQHWLESCPGGNLVGTDYSRWPSQSEPELILSDPLLREPAIGTTVQWVVGERYALRLLGISSTSPRRDEKTLSRGANPRRGVTRRDLHLAPLRPWLKGRRVRERNLSSTPLSCSSRLVVIGAEDGRLEAAFGLRLQCGDAAA